MSYGGLGNVSYAVGPGLRFPEYGFPRFDQLPQNERLGFDAPLLAGTIRGEPIVLAQRDPRYGTTGGRTITQPITLSRLRRAIDIERGYDTGPFVPSALDDVPFSETPAVRDGIFGLGAEADPERPWRYALWAFTAAVTLGLGWLAFRPPPRHRV